MKVYNGHRRLIKEGSTAVYADVEIALPAIDIHKESKKSGRLHVANNQMTVDLQGVAEGSAGIPLDFPRWLPFCAPKYHISPDINDYIIVPVIAIPSDLPNRNRIGFPLKELLSFNPELGMQTYETWRGKPTYREHQNNDITKAHGVVADTTLRKLDGWGEGKIWKLLMLATFDRSKYSDYVDRIISGDLNSYSMGAWVGGYTCSICDKEVGNCSHVSMEDRSPSMPEIDGKLAFKNCTGINGFELSSVANPAWITAISDTTKEFASQ